MRNRLGANWRPAALSSAGSIERHRSETLRDELAERGEVLVAEPRRLRGQIGGAHPLEARRLLVRRDLRAGGQPRGEERHSLQLAAPVGVPAAQDYGAVEQAHRLRRAQLELLPQRAP